MRKQTSKRLRFEIFKRDLFTCQYCGKQPPDVVLEIDHIHPVADGGKTEPLNLTTACADCNAGKSNVPLGLIARRPDADLLYLEGQQEIAEARRSIAQSEKLQAIRAELATQMGDLWRTITGRNPEYIIKPIQQLLLKYDVGVVSAAVESTALKVADRYIGPNSGDYVPYLWGTAKRMAEQQEA